MERESYQEARSKWVEDKPHHNEELRDGTYDQTPVPHKDLETPLFDYREKDPIEEFEIFIAPIRAQRPTEKRGRGRPKKV